MNTMDVYDVILSRYSVRKFSDREVDKDKLEKVLNAARLAPSWRNQQCWHFIVVDDDSVKRKIIRSTSLFNQGWLGSEPIIIVFCGDPQQSGFNNQQPYYLVDTAIAYTQMMLTATELGLGTCFIAGLEESQIKSILAIPESVRIVGLTPLGYPAEKTGLLEKVTQKIVRSHERKKLIEIVSHNAWNHSYEIKENS